VYAVSSAETAHLESLIARQKKGKTKKYVNAMINPFFKNFGCHE